MDQQFDLCHSNIQYQHTTYLPIPTQLYTLTHTQGFMVWRLPSRFPPLQDTLAKTAELDPDSLIAGYKIKSTYQEDYTGMQQGIISNAYIVMFMKGRETELVNPVWNHTPIKKCLISSKCFEMHFPKRLSSGIQNTVPLIRPLWFRL